MAFFKTKFRGAMDAWLMAVCMLVVACQLEAQPYWAMGAGGAGNQHVADVETDVDGSIYIIGEFSGAVQMDRLALASAGGLDVFMARLDASGNVQWLRRAGGLGIDRGLKLSVGGGATIAAVGEFMGEADLFGTTLTSQGSTTDMFVALINKTDGSLQWIRQGGGPLGTDSPGGVSIGPDGQVAVAGQFRGTAQWEGSFLTSTIDPATSLPGADVFIADYSPAGNLLWLKQGAAPNDDEAMDIIHDATGNLFVTGQFSQSITFGQAYANVMLNAGFLLCMAPDGTDTWFRRFGGAAYNRVRDMALDPAGGVVLVGDLQGTMTWSGAGATAVNVAGIDPHAYFLLKVGSDGQLLGSATEGSTGSVSANGVAVHGGNVAVFGSFDCQFSGFADHYNGSGLFMATGTEDLFIAMHASTGLALQEAQQFGGISDKVPGAICFLPDGDAVFTGSFKSNLIFPAAPGFTADISTEAATLQGNGVASYCGDPNYGSFAGILGTVAADGFIARGYVPGRAPYDWWMRSGTGCERGRSTVCISQVDPGICMDTIHACRLEGNMLVNLNFSDFFLAQDHSIGPGIDLLWQNGDTVNVLPFDAWGLWWVHVSSTNGCWQWADSLMAISLPLPDTPVVYGDAGSDLSVGPPYSIELCNPESHWLWGSVPADCIPQWIIWPGQVINSDSLLVDTTATCIFQVVNQYGCASGAVVAVYDHLNVPMDGLGMTMDVVFPLDADHNDTVDVCAQSFVGYNYIPSWTMNGAPVDHPPAGLSIHYNLSPLEPDFPATDGPEGGSVLITAEGWKVFHVVVRVDNGACGDTLYVHGIDSIFVRFLPIVDVTAQIIGPPVVCFGDTVLFTATCNSCDSLSWVSFGGEQVGEMGYEVWAPGMLILTTFFTDTNGCVNLGNANTMVTMPAPPVLSSSPPDGILCPGTAAALSTTSQGTNIVWYGPMGSMSGLGTSFTTALPGTYYVTMDIQGCPVTSNSVTITQYGTPFVSFSGDLALCFPGDEVTIQIQSTPGATVLWDAPLGGNALVQTVGQPGTYTCSVTACGITTPLSIDVVDGAFMAGITTLPPYLLCPGDTLVLQADTGDFSYTWLPGQDTGQALPVTQPGTYSVVMTNVYGCSDTSAMVQVSQAVVTSPISVVGDTVCAGDTAIVQASGIGTATWFDANGAVLGTGPSWWSLADSSAMVYVRMSDNGCFGPADSAWVEVRPSPPAPALTGTDSVCLGASLVIWATGPDSVQYSWATPYSTQQGAGITIPAATSADMGMYTCTPYFLGCPGPSATWEVAALPTEPSGLPTDTVVCAGNSLVLQLPPGFMDVVWSTGATGPTLELSGPMVVGVQAVDSNGCVLQAMVHVVMETCGVVIPNVFSPNGDGINDTWLPSGEFAVANAQIWNRWGNLVFVGNVARGGWDGRTPAGMRCNDGTYFYVLEIASGDGASERYSGTFQLSGSGQ